jgi:hypothetical protein
MKAFYLAAAAAAGLIAVAGASAARPAGMPTRAQLRACPAFRDLDFRKILAEAGAPAPDWRAGMDERHAGTRGPYASAVAAPADAKIVLRIWAGPGETQEIPTETSSLVWLGADDVWRVHRVDFMPTRPPPPKPPPAPDSNGVNPPYVNWTADEVARMSREEIKGPLDPQQAYGIEAALADPCFQLQPDSMPFDVPVRKGKAPRSPCYGVIGGTLEIAWADGRRRDVTELCGDFYARGIIQAVMYARPFAEDAETHAACNRLREAAARGMAGLEAAERRELAFCQSGLAATVRKKGLSEAQRDALYADASLLTPAEMIVRYGFLSEWSAGALRKAKELVEGR